MESSAIATFRFQSTLPRGSDFYRFCKQYVLRHFNPRSLAGATPFSLSNNARRGYFNPRSLAGATIPPCSTLRGRNDFNPRSLAGATVGEEIRLRLQGWISIHAPSRERLAVDKSKVGDCGISIHAPSRERQHQNKLLLYSFKSSIFCELAQLKYSKIYFDVRKLIVSHSSLSCEPKLNFMFHITSHRIILHYFYSCQSICK